MESGHFDTLTRALTASGSRRRALAALLGGMLLPVLGLTDATAKKGKGKKKKKKKNKGRSPAGNCPTGTSACGGACVDTQTDPGHCGGCGRPCAVQPPETCGTTGLCVGAACERYGQAPTVCKGRVCSGSAVSLGPSFCDGRGACVRFSAGNQACKPGRCDNTTGGCTWNCALDSDCDEQGWCDDARICRAKKRYGSACTRSEECTYGNCVGEVCCESACVAANATGTCVAPGGYCSLACNAGWGNCDTTMSNGCEADLETSPAHCGGCNQPCSGPCGPSNSGTKECVGGACFCTF